MLETNQSCSLSCFKIHKESCRPKLMDAAGQEETDTMQETQEPDDQLPQWKLVKEYNLVSAGQLATLRSPHLSSILSFREE